MADESKLTEVELVACAECEKEIPKAVALRSEDQEYVLYFCSQSCFEEWSDEAMELKIQDAGEP
jgi:hypothetical protein